jgi:hypothetical protein
LSSHHLMADSIGTGQSLGGQVGTVLSLSETWLDLASLVVTITAGRWPTSFVSYDDETAGTRKSLRIGSESTAGRWYALRRVEHP